MKPTFSRSIIFTPFGGLTEKVFESLMLPSPNEQIWWNLVLVERRENPMTRTRVALGKGLSALLACMLLAPFPVAAQQSQSWQGPRVRQLPTPASPSQASPSPDRQKPPPLGTQPKGEGHPQVKEMPAAQPPAARAPQPIPPPSSQQPSALAPQPEPAVPSQPPLAVVPPGQLPAKPAYLGLVGKTAMACRNPTGIRVTHVIEGSPAQKAGIKGERSLTWKEAALGLLAMSPASFLALPFLGSVGRGLTEGDLIMAMDGKRVHKREDLERELEQVKAGDMVYFSIMRGNGEMHQVPVRLTAYPTDPTPPTQQAHATPVPQVLKK